MTEEINHPDRYNKDGIEVKDVMKAYTKNLTGYGAFCINNAIKYILRFQEKNGTEDLKKAVWYLEDYIKEYPDEDTVTIYADGKELMKKRDEFNNLKAVNAEELLEEMRAREYDEEFAETAEYWNRIADKFEDLVEKIYKKENNNGRLD